MAKTTIQDVIQTAIVSAFTIATALIWKDVIIEIIELLVPSGKALIYKIIAAVLATLLVVAGIYAALKTESEAEVVIEKIKKGNHQMLRRNQMLRRR